MKKKRKNGVESAGMVPLWCGVDCVGFQLKWIGCVDVWIGRETAYWSTLSVSTTYLPTGGGEHSSNIIIS